MGFEKEPRDETRFENIGNFMKQKKVELSQLLSLVELLSFAVLTQNCSIHLKGLF